MHARFARIGPLVCAAAVACAWLLAALPVAAAEGARIALLQGKGERSEGPSRDAWAAAAQGDIVEGGYWVRTLANSQMGLIVPQRNQIRLNQNSEMQLKTAEETQQFAQARVNLAKGRAWSQARPRPSRGGPIGQPTLAMETPSATMSIRGTDWEVEVGEDGRTQLVVLSGEVDMGNDFGSVKVAKGEAAVAEVGKAPVKLVLIHPETRVQWVSSWQPQPARWLGADAGRHAAAVQLIDGGDYSGALARLEPQAATDAGAAILAADLLIQQGDIERAVNVLAPHAKDGQGDARASALLARAEARRDHLPQAEQILDSAVAAHPDEPELLLARAEIAILRGDAPLASATFERALVALHANTSAAGADAARDPRTADIPAREALIAEAWYGLGLIASEREYVRDARRNLDAALAHDPSLGKAEAELAAVDSFAGNLKQAQQRLDALLAKEPQNYLALTGRGVNHLKQGHPEAALQDFMQAGLIEPRYARAWLYSGVAFYQQGERMRALQAFHKAQELDARDPIPYMMESQTQANELDFGSAVKSARRAQELMPYLRSLNQLANDQRGSANLGSPLADFGMEEWATSYAYEAYSPYWGGSHLFLADRYTGLVNKNSELMKGFLTDPLAFGASNRDATLVQKPGHYQRLDARYEHYEWEIPAAELTLNGMVAAPQPMAYFVKSTLRDADRRDSGSSNKGKDFVVGLGVKPRDDLGIFVFATDTSQDGQLDEDRLSNGDIDIQGSRVDGGINFKLNPENQFWLKAGDGSQHSGASSNLFSQQTADRFKAINLSPFGRLNRNFTSVDENDVQFRHAFTAAEALWTWGAEHAEQEQNLQTLFDFRGRLGATPITLANSVREGFAAEDETVYASMRFHLMPRLEVELDGAWQHQSTEQYSNTLIAIPDIPGRPVFVVGRLDVDGRERETDVNGRAGLRWDVGSGQVLRVVAQRWRRPASFGTLAPVDTLGVAVNDRLPSVGGIYERVRMQFDGEFAERFFLQVFADHEEVDNGLAAARSPTFSFAVEQLLELRAREQFFAPEQDIEATPVFAEGEVDTLALAVNALVTDRVTASARYLWRDGEQKRVNDGEGIPYIPRSYLLLGSEVSLPGRWLLGAHAIYRGQRNSVELDRPVIEGGWSYGLKAYWETVDKHSSVELILDRLSSNKDALLEDHTKPHLLVQYSYRF